MEIVQIIMKIKTDQNLTVYPVLQCHSIYVLLEPFQLNASADFLGFKKPLTWFISLVSRTGIYVPEGFKQTKKHLRKTNEGNSG